MEIVGDLPKGHAELADQLVRAAQSQPRKIAEGAGRRTAALDTMRVMKLGSGPIFSGA